MNLLVATRNKDKYDIVRRMVEAIIPDAHTVSLDEADVSGDVVEVGSIAQRAAQKALYFLERLQLADRVGEFDGILAVDDGLSIGGDEATPNSKELTDRILRSEWPIGTSIAVIRAFSLVKRGEQARIEITTVPFSFIGNNSGIIRESGKYPLSQVLAPQGSMSPVSQMSKEEEDAFNLAHSSEALSRLLA